MEVKWGERARRRRKKAEEEGRRRDDVGSFRFWKGLGAWRYARLWRAIVLSDLIAGNLIGGEDSQKLQLLNCTVLYFTWTST